MLLKQTMFGLSHLTKIWLLGAMGQEGDGGLGIEPPFAWTWKHVLLYVVFFVVSQVLFGLLIPELSPMWSAVLFALLFTVVAVLGPLLLARVRRQPLPSS